MGQQHADRHGQRTHIPLLRSVVDCNNALPAEADNGAVVMDAIAGTGGGLEPFNGLPFTGAWVSWSGTWPRPARDYDGNTITWNFTLAHQHTWVGDCLFLHDPGVAEAWAYFFNGAGTLTLPVRAHTTGTPEIEVWINGNLSGTTGIIPSCGSTTLVMQVNQPGIVKVSVKQAIGSGRAYIDNVAWTGCVISNEPPIAFDDRYTTLLNTAVQVPAPGVLANDYAPRAAPCAALTNRTKQYGRTFCPRRAAPKLQMSKRQSTALPWL